MGYTHYWTMKNKLSSDTIARMILFTNEAIRQFGKDNIVNGMGEKDSKPQVTTDCITLNGLGDDSYETFLLNFKDPGDNHCKTEQKPYDTLVVACLACAERLGVIEELSSDGCAEDQDFDDGIKLYEAVLPVVGPIMEISGETLLVETTVLRCKLLQ